MIGPLVYIKNIEQKGLRLQWNFTGLKGQPNYQTYHILLTLGVKKLEIQKIMRVYFNKIELGELFGFYIYQTQGKDQRVLTWMEKTSFNLEVQFAENIHINWSTKPQIVSQLVQSLIKIKGLVIVNIVIGSTIQTEQTSISLSIRKKIIQIRKLQQNSDKIVFNIIQAQKNDINNVYKEESQFPKINCLDGINFFNFKRIYEDLCQNNKNKGANTCESPKKSFKNSGSVPAPTNFIDQIFKYLPRIVVKKLTIKIISNNRNSYFKLSNDSSWRISQTSQLEKTYYSIPICNFQQYLIFILEKQSQAQIELNLDIQLRIQFYSGKQIHSRKLYTLDTNSQFHKSKTTYVVMQDYYEPIEIGNIKDYWVLSNLYEKKSYVWVDIIDRNK